MFEAGQKPSVADGTVAEAGTETKRVQLDRALAALLRELESRYARGGLTLHDPVLALAREHVEQAVAMGAGEQHGRALDALVGAIARKQPAADLANSRTPHHNGIVLPAPPAILKGYESFHWQTSKEAREWARRRGARGTGDDRRSGRETRRFKRYSAPSLWVSVDGLHYRTIDWSIGGLSLVGTKTDLPPGREVRVTLAANTRETQPPIFADRATVVRCDREAGRLSLQFRNSASATLKILEHLSRKKVEPVEVIVRREGEDG
jgi:hypothetical protein